MLHRLGLYYMHLHHAIEQSLKPLHNAFGASKLEHLLMARQSKAVPPVIRHILHISSWSSHPMAMLGCAGAQQGHDHCNALEAVLLGPKRIGLRLDL